MIPILDIDEQGNISTLYSDEIDLYQLGQVTHVRRASEILFNELKQYWEVLDAKTKEIVYQNKNRELAIKKEIELFSPGGKFYHD